MGLELSLTEQRRCRLAIGGGHMLAARSGQRDVTGVPVVTRLCSFVFVDVVFLRSLRIQSNVGTKQAHNFSGSSQFSGHWTESTCFYSNIVLIGPGH